MKKGKGSKRGKKFVRFFVIFKWIFLVFRFVFSVPFYLVNFFIIATGKTRKVVENKKVRKRRKLIIAKYRKFKVVKKISGEFDDWEKKIIRSDSTIGIVLGARGSGKSALAIKHLENLYCKTKKRIYAMGFNANDMPSWIDVIESTSKIKNNSHVLIDEGGILFSSRKSMSSANKLLGELMLIARHKNISILFISQNSSNLDINVLRQADYLLLKPSSLLQKNFERKIIKDIYTEIQEDFKKYKKDKGATYVHSDDFMGFVSNPLPSFWNKRISKSWK